MINFKEDINDIDILELGLLKTIKGYPNGLDDGGYDIVHLNFEYRTVELTYHPEYDTIEMRYSDRRDDLLEISSLQKILITKNYTKLSWYHIMSNNLNYIDGIQFQFSNGEEGISVQFYVSSSIYVYELLPVK